MGKRLTYEAKMARLHRIKVREDRIEGHQKASKAASFEARYEEALAEERRRARAEERAELRDVAEATEEEQLTWRLRHTPGWPGPDAQPSNAWLRMEQESFPSCFNSGERGMMKSLTSPNNQRHGTPWRMVGMPSQRGEWAWNGRW